MVILLSVPYLIIPFHSFIYSKIEQQTKKFIQGRAQEQTNLFFKSAKLRATCLSLQLK